MCNYNTYIDAHTVVWEKFKVGNIRVKKVRGKNIFVSAGCRRNFFNAKHFAQ